MMWPDWFILLKEWGKTRGSALTLPFIVGAIAYKDEKDSLSKKFVKEILDDIAYNPVEGYRTEVRWCSDIDEPVFQTENDNVPCKLSKGCIEIVRSSGKGSSIVFSSELQSAIHFGTSDTGNLLKRLVTRTIGPVLEGKFSKCRKGFSKFSQTDIEFIKKTIMTTKNEV